MKIVRESILGLLFFSVSIFYSFPLQSNGGPIEGSTLVSTGNVQLKKFENVDLLSEKLFIRPIDDYVNIQLIYELNCRDDNKTVDFGFPFYNKHVGLVDFQSFKNSDNDSIKYFKMTINNSDVTLTQKINKIKREDFFESDEDDEIKWYLSKIKLNKGINIIQINYLARSSYNGDEGSDRIRTFVYNFKPAAGWGKGVVDKLEIVIDTFVLDMKKIDFKINGIKGFQKQNYNQSVIIEKVNFSKLRDLEIAYDLEKYYKKYRSQVLKNKTSLLVKNISASSSLKGPYSVKNLIDGTFKTAWAEGADGNGIGEWIEVDFKEGVKNIAIANGFMRSSKLFTNNSRIKKVQCDIQGNKKGADGSSFSFSKTITIDDLKTKYFALLNWGEDDFEGVNKEINVTSILIAPEDFDCDYEITKIRITIKDVYPGIKFEDTCITEFFAF